MGSGGGGIVSVLKLCFVVSVVVVVVESIVPFHQNTECLVVALHIGLLWQRIGEIITAALITMDF